MAGAKTGAGSGAAGLGGADLAVVGAAAMVGVDSAAPGAAWVARVAAVDSEAAKAEARAVGVGGSK